MRDFDGIIRQLLDEWNSAEEALKQAETVQGEVVAPSINELRYAGRKVVEALALPDDETDQALRLLDDAVFDCMRARHDAIDAITAFITEKIDDLTARLGVDVVLTCYPDMPRLVAELGRVQDAIVRSRENRLDRDAIYATLMATDLPKIYAMYQALRRNEGLMRSLAEKHERERRRNRMAFWAGTVLAVLGVLVGLAGLVWRP